MLTYNKNVKMKRRIVLFFCLLSIFSIIFWVIGQFLLTLISSLLNAMPTIVGGFFIFLFTLVGIVQAIRNSGNRINNSIIWFLLALSLPFAMIPVMHIGVYHNGYAAIEPDLVGLVNNIGKEVISPQKMYMYIIRCDANNQDLFIGVGDAEWDVYNKDFKIIANVTFEETDGPNCISAFNYIKEIFGIPVWVYVYSTGNSFSNYLLEDLHNIHISNAVKKEGEHSQLLNNSDNVEEYEDLGPIDSYADNLKSDDGGDSGISYMRGSHLYVKSYNGKEAYYITIKGSSDYRPLTRGSYKRSGERFNGRATNFSGHYIYVNVPYWEPSAGSSSSGSSGGTIIIEHNGPRQEWIQCTGCYGSGKCSICNGTGRNLYSTHGAECIACGGWGRCEFCAGQGGHYETRY